MSTFFQNIFDNIFEFVYSLLPNHQDFIPFDIFEVFTTFLDYVFVFDFILPVSFLLQLLAGYIAFEITLLTTRVIMWTIKTVSNLT